MKDAVARSATQGGTYFLGVTSTEITDGASTSPIVISGQSVTPTNGNMVAYGNKELVYAASDQSWHELGDLTNLGALALKDNATAQYTPAGTITFSGTPMESTGTFTPTGTATFPGAQMNFSGSYTPEGSITKPDITVTPDTAVIKEFDNSGSVTNGSAASMVLPTWNATVTGENLVFSWNAGSFTPNVPTTVALPTSKNTEVMTGATAALDSAPAFTGTTSSVTVAGTPSGTVTFTGETSNVSVSGTPAGAATFVGTQATITSA